VSHVRLVQDVYAAFGRGDVATVLATFDSRIEWREAEGHPYSPRGETWIGPDAVLQKLFARIAADWDGFTVHTRTFHDAGDTVVVEGRYTGTFKPTGQVLDAQLCHLWTLRAGKVARFQQYVDTAQLQAVMGARG
jgi:uncharacterized protein